MIQLSTGQRRKARDRLSYILDALADLGAYVYHESVTTASIYVKFNDPRLRSLRIADHRGRKRYRYKWNLEIGGEPRVETDCGVRRFYYSAAMTRAQDRSSSP